MPALSIWPPWQPSRSSRHCRVHLAAQLSASATPHPGLQVAATLASILLLEISGAARVRNVYDSSVSLDDDKYYTLIVLPELLQQVRAAAGYLRAVPGLLIAGRFLRLAYSRPEKRVPRAVCWLRLPASPIREAAGCGYSLSPRALSPYSTPVLCSPHNLLAVNHQHSHAAAPHGAGRQLC